MRNPESLRQHHADLRVPLIVGLQPGEHEIERFLPHGACEHVSHAEGVRS
jgi:hypothetical protein